MRLRIRKSVDFIVEVPDELDREGVSEAIDEALNNMEDAILTELENAHGYWAVSFAEPEIHVGSSVIMEE